MDSSKIKGTGMPVNYTRLPSGALKPRPQLIDYGNFSDDGLPTEKVKLQYYTTGETFEERTYHIVAHAPGKVYHLCAHWCGVEILNGVAESKKVED